MKYTLCLLLILTACNEKTTTDFALSQCQTQRKPTAILTWQLVHHPSFGRTLPYDDYELAKVECVQ